MRLVDCFDAQHEAVLEGAEDAGFFGEQQVGIANDGSKRLAQFLSEGNDHFLVAGCERRRTTGLAFKLGDLRVGICQ